jgi:hypothetical protein
MGSTTSAAIVALESYVSFVAVRRGRLLARGE